MVPVVRRQLEARFKQPPSDRPAHVADPDKSKPAIFLRDWFHDSILALSRDFIFNFRVGRKHARYRFARRTEFFMQDAGSKEDTHLRREDLIVSWRQLCVESFGRCQYAGNWIFSAASELSLPFSLGPGSPKQQFARPIQKHRSCMCCP